MLRNVPEFSMFLVLSTAVPLRVNWDWFLSILNYNIINENRTRAEEGVNLAKA